MKNAYVVMSCAEEINRMYSNALEDKKIDIEQYTLKIKQCISECKNTFKYCEEQLHTHMKICDIYRNDAKQLSETIVNLQNDLISFRARAALKSRMNDKVGAK